MHDIIKPMNRRTAIAVVAHCVTGTLLMAQASAASTGQHVKVARDPGCGCCEKWVAHLQTAGFTTEITDRDDMQALKTQFGVPEALRSCHTGQVAGYVIEGHVPAAAILALIASKEAATGLAVPGMPIGSPGMEGGDPADWETFDVVVFGPGGQRVFGVYKGSDRV